MYKEDVGFATGAVLLIAIVIAVVVFVVHSSNHWAQQCHDQGGHTVNVDRKQVCLTADNVYLGHS